MDGESATEEVAFVDIDGADFAGPVVDILEEVGVDFLEMCEVEVAFDGGVEELYRAIFG